MNLETKIIIYKFTPQVFTLTRFFSVLKSCKLPEFIRLFSTISRGFSLYLLCYYNKEKRL